MYREIASFSAAHFVDETNIIKILKRRLLFLIIITYHIIVLAYYFPS